MDTTPFARRRALQAVYAWQMSGGEVGQVIAQYGQMVYGVLSAIVFAETGLVIRVLTGEEEARYAALGVIASRA